tara:strand:+ start:101 stop:307 length:207 start_codon:yes stop_codon:yes gene_type:complete
LDGDVHKLRGIEQVRYTIYYHCASQFGWDKEQVDRQPTDYLKKLFSTHTEVMAENEKNQSIPLSKNFK